MALRIFFLLFATVIPWGRWKITVESERYTPAEVKLLQETIAKAEKIVEDYLGLPQPMICRMRVAPSSGDFAAWTGCSIWQGASVYNGELITQPLEILEKRGVLEETIVHEYVHLVLLPYRVPLWMNEGLAVICSGQVRRFGTERNLPVDTVAIERLLRSRDTLELRRGYLAAALLTQETLLAVGRDSLARLIKEEAR